MDLNEWNLIKCTAGKEGEAIPGKKRRLEEPASIHINHLPDECILHIFSFLPSFRDRCSCAAVSKKWLLLQAQMGTSEFKSVPSPLKPHNNIPTCRCLEGEAANDARLAAIAVGIGPWGGLTELSLRENYRLPTHGITDFGLTIIARSCPNLQSLALWGCHKVRNRGIQSIAGACNSLKKLHLLDLASADDVGLISIAKNCPSLTTLSIESCPLISNGTLHAFAGYSSNLESISLSRCPLLDGNGIISIISALHKLAELKLVCIRAGDDVLQVIARQASSLKSLCMDNISGISEVGFCPMDRLQKVRSLSPDTCCGLNGNQFAGLKALSVRNCAALTDEGLKQLTEFAAPLESLKLVECNHISEAGLVEMFMNCCKRLKVLSLVRCRGIREENLSKPGGDFLPKCPSLHTLILNGCSGIGDSFLSWLASACVQIKHLDLIGLISVTDRGVLSLLQGFETQNKALVSVNLSRCFGLTDWSVLAITSAFGQRLRSLRLGSCGGLSDRSLELIGGLCHCLLELDLSRCGISDSGVDHLVKSKHQCIEVLSLAGCAGITDKSLGLIEIMCGSLIGLNVKQCTSLTKRGIKSIRKTLWWCDLLY
ncbi:hypothetical protein ACLOJK_004902 [Asimina triloba]